YIYINGVNDGGSYNGTGGSLTYSSGSSYIGTVFDRWFTLDGILDDVRVYNRALSEEEIRSTMHIRLNGNEPGLVGYWDFDEGEGQAAYDMTANANDGQLGSTAGVDESDPEWVESDAPIGLCNNVALDIKPGSCPNPLNLKSKGILPVAVLGSEVLDVNDIDLVSVRLAGVSPIRSSLEDVATPVTDINDCNCTTDGPDGYIDLTLKFRTQEIVEALLEEYYELEKDQAISLRLVSELNDGSVIVGEDCIVLVGNVPKYLLARVSDINGDGVVNMMDLAELAKYWLENTEP
ncbi:MAG: LamG-like jellyroll fold domain-containing protein, partial [Planctomycetota bacterium]